MQNTDTNLLRLLEPSESNLLPKQQHQLGQQKDSQRNMVSLRTQRAEMAHIFNSKSDSVQHVEAAGLAGQLDILNSTGNSFKIGNLDGK